MNVVMSRNSDYKQKYTATKMMQRYVGKACATGMRHYLTELVKADAAAGCTSQ